MVYILVGAAGFLGAALRYSMGVLFFRKVPFFHLPL